MRSTINNYYNKLRETNILSNFFNLSSIQVSNILLFLITIRIIAARYDLDGFGRVSLAYKISMLAGAVISYGTAQSAVRDIAYHLTKPLKLSVVIYRALGIRFILFLLFLPDYLAAIG